MRTGDWIREEDDFLVNNRDKYSARELADLIGRTFDDVRARIRKLKIKKNIQVKIGQVFNLLTIIEEPYLEQYDKKQKQSKVKCRCECGNIKDIWVNHLKCGSVTSCGCLSEKNKENFGKDKITHGKGNYNYRLYRIYRSMKQRCYNDSESNADNYKNYGGRNIQICKEWIDDFANFETWAIAHGYQDNLTIDRIDVNGDYSPENCRWTSLKDQARNKRGNKLVTAFGETKCIAEWVDDPRCVYKSYWAIRERLKIGWHVERAITEPYSRGRRNFK